MDIIKIVATYFRSIDLVKLIKDNMLWEILVVVFLLLVALLKLTAYKLFRFRSPVEMVKGVIRANRISKDLLKGNRPNYGRGCPTHLADRFIDIWCSSSHGLRYGSRFQRRFFENIALLEKYMDEQLEKLGLIEIDKQNNIMKPIRTQSNTLIYKKCKSFLIKYAGDTKEYYEGLWKRSLT